MSKTIAAVQSLDGHIRFIYQGCLVKMRAADWYAALAAGKAERRASQQAAREQAGQARQDAQALGWIDTDAPERP
jgi:hypothetical protein